MALRSIRDMLSNLPEEILENICSSLSIRDVVRTSILSTNWRYKWISVPHLIFNDECIPVSDGSLGGHDKLVKIVNHVLLLHRGPSLPNVDVPRRLTYTYGHLKRISFRLNLEDMKEILVSICLLNSSPNLQELEIRLWNFRKYAIVPVMDLQEVNDQLECTFNKLRVINISELFGMEIELVLVKYILANSPMLVTMNISLAKWGIEVVPLLKELLQFKRASPQAEIV
ncbi:F-box/LRR-repeat protein At1g55660-like [Telopea speciosissima]|uniref:F-box/LRR-repeat protein At1g55660-like n=1 Tax=Telopea speciosissima TaxID=54955 RepID=UPI001CC801D0|nr:F-box/LRR-repeat protein At1g55660-like [Telopea speciosissima]